MQIVYSGYRAVDTFFFIGGFLVAKSLLSQSFCIPSRGLSADTDPPALQEHDNGINDTGEEHDNGINDTGEEHDNGNDTGEEEGSTAGDDAVLIARSRVLWMNSFFDEEVWKDYKVQGFKKTAKRFWSKYVVYVIHRIIR